MVISRSLSRPPKAQGSGMTYPKPCSSRAGFRGESDSRTSCSWEFAGLWIILLFWGAKWSRTLPFPPVYVVIDSASYAGNLY